MLDKKTYANGQKVYHLENDFLTFYFKTGVIKAKGPFVNGKMEGEWIFYRETGQLWQVGHFKDHKKHGRFIRYNRENEVEYDEMLEHDKVIKKEI